MNASKEKKGSRTVALVIVVCILMCVLNAGVTLALVVNFKDQIDSANSAGRAQGVLIEHRLCTSLNRLSMITPPSGNPYTNPSRGYEQQEHTILDELGPDIDCPK